jgi:glycosyltransferase involved in cell wall biosynthesis
LAIRVSFDCLILREPYTGVGYSILRMVESLAEGDEARQYSALVPRSFSRKLPQNVDVRRSWLVGGSSATSRVFYEQLVLPFTAYRHRADYFHFPAWVAPKMLRIPYVLTVHDVIPFLYPAFCRNATVKHFKSLVPRSVQNAMAVIVPSESVKRDFGEVFRNCPMDKVHVVPFAPVHPSCQQRGHEAKKLLEKAYSIDAPYFLAVGNIEPRKNLPTLLKAFFAAKVRRNFPHKLVLVGPSPKGFPKLDRIIEGHGMGEMVISLDYVPEEHIAHLYSCCTAFCFPSLTEGFGLPLLEALQEGCRCLVSDIPAFHELAGKDAQYLPVTDLAAWREAIEVAADKGSGDAVARKIRQDRAASFTWKRTAEGIRAVYRKVEEELRL